MVTGTKLLKVMVGLSFLLTFNIASGGKLPSADAKSHSNGVITNYISEFQSGTPNYRTIKEDNRKIRLDFQSQCSEAKLGTIKSRFCGNVGILKAERKYLLLIEKDPIKDAYINGGDSLKKEIELCEARRFPEQCLENILYAKIVNIRAQNKDIPFQKVIYKCGNRVIKAQYYLDEIPAVLIQDGKQKIMLYRFPQNKGRFFSEITASAPTSIATHKWDDSKGETIDYIQEEQDTLSCKLAQ